MFSLLLISLFATPIFAQNTVLYSSASGTSDSSTSISTASVSIDTSTVSTSSMKPVVGITGLHSTSTQTTTTAFNSAAPQATNVQPCNGYVELCDRKLSNVSLVVAHNSPFVVLHNAASNQDLGVLTQLGDGIRGCKFLKQSALCGPTFSSKWPTWYQDNNATVLRLTNTYSAIRDPLPQRDRRPAPLPHLLRPPRCRPPRNLPQNSLELALG